jgi:hypothetical protein
MRGEERLQIMAQSPITGAGFIKERGPLARLAFKGRIKQLLDLPPP